LEHFHQDANSLRMSDVCINTFA